MCFIDHSMARTVKGKRTGTLTLGICFMAAGIALAGITYREMRTQRVLHEPVRVCRMDLSKTSNWQTEPLSLFQTGTYTLWLSADNPRRQPGSNQSIPQAQQSGDIIYGGETEIVVERTDGQIALRTSLGTGAPGSDRQDGLVLFRIDSVIVDDPFSLWRISARVALPDPQFSGKLAEIVIIPPGPTEFGPYVQRESYKLFAAGILIVAGFIITIFGGTFLGRRISKDTFNSTSQSKPDKDNL